MDNLDLERGGVKPITTTNKRFTQMQGGLHYVHYLIIVSSYMYIKSFETCNKSKFDCDFYYDKFTILYKLILIVASGFINAFLLFIAMLKFCKKRFIVLEAAALGFSFIAINYIFKKEGTFEYSGTLYALSLAIFFILFLCLHIVCNISLLCVRLYNNIKKLLLIDFIIKLKLFIFADLGKFDMNFS
jgi:hypothetical protein